MSDLDLLRLDRLDLADAVDHLLNKGAVLTGDATLSLAGVDLVYVGLNVLIASVETLRESERTPPPTHPQHLGEGIRDHPRVASISSGVPGASVRPAAVTENSPPQRLGEGSGEGGTPVSELPPSSPHLYADPETRVTDAPALLPEERPEQGLARLVLTLIELLRQVLERQALRRVEGNGLTDEQIERMGLALMELETKMVELRSVFGLSEEDLVLDLGPLEGLRDRR
jgi:hypothetical protein